MQGALQAQLDHFVRIGAIGPQNRLHTPIQLHHAHALFQAGHGHNLGPGLIFSNHPGCKAGLSNGQNSIGANLRRNLHGGVTDSVRRVNAFSQALLAEEGDIVQRFLRALGNLSHGLHCLQGIFAGSSLTAQHDHIRAVKNRIGHIAGLGTGSTIAVHHAFQHLGGSDNGLARLVAAGNNLLLHNGHILSGNFHAQITAGHHHSVGHINNLINIFHTGLILNFGDDAHMIAIFLQHLANGNNIIGLLHKGGSYIIHIILSGKENILPVLLRQKGQLQLDAGASYTLTGAELATVNHNGVNLRTCNSGDLKGEEAISQQNTAAHGQLLRQASIIHMGLMLVTHIFLRSQGELITLTKLNLIILEHAQAHLRALGIGNGGNHLARPCCCLAH